MIASGWEVGSHSVNHADLSINHGIASYEIVQSKQALEQALGGDVQTFAYPFGLTDSYLGQLTKGAGYRAGMGLGITWTYTEATQFYLSRIEIHGDFTLEDFAVRLPWADLG